MFLSRGCLKVPPPLHPNFDSPVQSEWSDTFTFSTGQKRSDATAIVYDENNFHYQVFEHFQMQNQINFLVKNTAKQLKIDSD